MIQNLREQVKEYGRRHRFKGRWGRVLAVLACAVVFCTTYALILPAITLDQETVCGLEEHTHLTESCYARELICTDESTEHVHSDACYVSVLTCEIPEHQHSEACYPQETEENTSEPVTESQTSADTEALTGGQQEASVEAVTENPTGAVTEEEPKERTLTEQVLDAVIYSDDSYRSPLSDPGVVITLKGTLPEGVMVKAYPVSAELEDATVTVVEAYDIGLFVTVTDETTGEPVEKEYEPETPVEVTIVSEKLNAIDAVEVYHIADAPDSVPEKVYDEVEVKEAEVKFSAKEFSVYVLAAEQEKGTEEESESGSSDQAERMDNDGIAVMSVTDNGNGSFTMEPGDTLIVNENGYNHNYRDNYSQSSDPSVARLSINNGTATITAVSAGTSTVTLGYRQNGNNIGYVYLTITVQESVPEGQARLRFDTNGGSGSVDPIMGAVGSVITLPDYSGTRSGYTFVGWTETQNAATLPSTNYGNIYASGASYTLEGSTTLYAVWKPNSVTSKDTTGYFYIRLDGTIPYEPSSYGSASYTDAIVKQNVITVQNWVTDSDVTKPLVEGGNCIANDVYSVLKDVPTDQEIKKVYSSYNPETQYILWYVQKYQSTSATLGQTWHIDGVVLDRAKVSISYDANVPSGVTSNPSVPLGYQVTAGTEVSVGESESVGSNKYGSAVPSIAGYTFLGWNTKADGSGTAYKNYDKLTLNENTTLYAQWSSTGNVLQLKKVDTSGTVIEGAQFTMQESNAAAISFTAGTYTNNRIKTNTVYTVTETKAPDGYNLLINEITITPKSATGLTVGGTGAEADGLTVTVTNQTGETLPNTGGKGVGRYTFSGLALMAAAMLGGLMYSGRKRRKGGAW